MWPTVPRFRWQHARNWLLLALGMGLSNAWAAHGYALWGARKYPSEFTHFD